MYPRLYHDILDTSYLSTAMHKYTRGKRRSTPNRHTQCLAEYTSTRQQIQGVHYAVFVVHNHEADTIAPAVNDRHVLDGSSLEMSEMKTVDTFTYRK